MRFYRKNKKLYSRLWLYSFLYIEQIICYMSIAITCYIVYNTIKGWCFRGALKRKVNALLQTFLLF